MALPKLNVPVYEFTSHNGTVIKHTMTVMRDEKLLAIAAEKALNENQADSERIITEAAVAVLKSVLISPEIETLTSSEIEELFLHVRAVSNSNILELAYVADRECIAANHQNRNDVEVDILSYTVKSPGKSIEDIVNEHGMIKRGNRWVYMLSDDIGVVLQEPRGIQYTDDDVILACIESVFQGENVQTEISEEELNIWLDSLTRKQLAVIREFIGAIPVVCLKIDIVCRDCGKTRTTELKGLSSFFG